MRSARAADAHVRTIREHEAKAIAVFGLANVLKVDDRHAVRANERLRGQPAFERGQRGSNQMVAARRMNRDAVVLCFDPYDLFGAQNDGTIALIDSR
jgi:metal-dependent amidase/aminoacylase/carboxypeptidase family protein